MTNYYGTTDIAALCGVSRPTASNWKARGHLPEPFLTTLSGISVWTEEQALEVLAWHSKREEIAKRRRALLEALAELKE